MTPANEMLLLTTLEAAVPLWIERVRALPASVRTERAAAAAQTICEKGDVLQFGGKGCAEAFNALALALAILSFCPGGVKFRGLHWQTETI